MGNNNKNLFVICFLKMFKNKNRFWGERGIYLMSLIFKGFKYWIFILFLLLDILFFGVGNIITMFCRSISS